MFKENKPLRVEGIIQMAEVKNHNGRIYEKEILEREIKKYMNDGVNVYPVQYIGLCESLGIDVYEFSEKPDFII